MRWRERTIDGVRMCARMCVRVCVMLFAGVVTACGSRTPMLESLDGDDCRRTVIVGRPAEAVEDMGSDAVRQAVIEALAVDWRQPAESVEVLRLNAWCAAVGPAVVGGWGQGEIDFGVDLDLDPADLDAADLDAAPDPDAEPDTVDAEPAAAATEAMDTTTAANPAAPVAASEPELAVADTVWLVSWNKRVGGGDLRGLVDDLREGRLTPGQRPEHFIVLLQETYRGGDLVPAPDPALPGGSGILEGPPTGSRDDIVALAEELELWLAYAPSMRNGESEDRGNAILSTLRLENVTAIGLPVARQRRVALSADVSGRTRAGEVWRMQVATVHLESQPSGWESDEAQRLRQAETLLALLPDADVAIAGGDFNTKTRAQDEALVAAMRRAYPNTPPFPMGPTYRRAFGFYREYLDYIFYRIPDRASGRYDRVENLYGSDHYPLVGWVAW